MLHHFPRAPAFFSHVSAWTSLFYMVPTCFSIASTKILRSFQNPFLLSSSANFLNTKWWFTCSFNSISKYMLRSWNRMISQKHGHHLLSNFPVPSALVVQTIKNLPAMQETQVQSLGQEGPLEKGMASHSSNLD